MGQLGKESIQQNLENGVYVVKNGIIKPITAPHSGFGKTVISWEAGKPTRAEHQYSEKL